MHAQTQRTRYAQSFNRTLRGILSSSFTSIDAKRNALLSFMGSVRLAQKRGAIATSDANMLRERAAYHYSKGT